MKTREINLRVEYSDPELAEKRDELSNVVLGAHEVESQKSAVNKGFKEQLEALYSRRDVLAHQIKARAKPGPCCAQSNSTSPWMVSSALSGWIPENSWPTNP